MRRQVRVEPSVLPSPRTGGASAPCRSGPTNPRTPVQGVQERADTGHGAHALQQVHLSDQVAPDLLRRGHRRGRTQGPDARAAHGLVRDLSEPLPRTRLQPPLCSDSRARYHPVRPSAARDRRGHVRRLPARRRARTCCSTSCSQDPAAVNLSSSLAIRNRPSVRLAPGPVPDRQ
ncbi:hypothetical protein T492DRAFT_36522, partial [Pavlovales sp. CCMP2436]